MCYVLCMCSPENLSSGDGALVVDLSSMANVTVNLPAMTATVQMGARHGNMYHVVTTAGRWDNRSSVTTSGAGWPQVRQQLRSHTRPGTHYCGNCKR
jgi:hypothetical protein